MGENIYRIFDGVWNLSLVGGYCVLLVILARLLLQKAPKWCSYLLWGIVFVRLCCPILPETGISLIPDKLLSVGTEMTSGQQTVGPGSHGYAEANDTKDIGDALRREYDAEEVPDSQAAEKTMTVGNDNTVMNADGTQDFSLGTARTESGATVAEVAASGTDAVISETSAGTGTDARAWTYPVWFRVLSMVWLECLASWDIMLILTCVCVTGFTDPTAVSDRWNRGSVRSMEDICPSSWGWSIR